MGEKERSLIYELCNVRNGGKPKLFGGFFDPTVLGVDEALAEGETPRSAVWGKFSNNGRFGLLVGTDSRLIGFNKGFTGTVDEHEIPYDMIKTISHKLGWVFGEITISTFPSGGIHMGEVNKKIIPVFVDWVRARIDAPTAGATRMGRGEHTTVASLGRNTTQSFADELTKLAALRDSNALTEAEFIEAKKRFLNR